MIKSEKLFTPQAYVESVVGRYEDDKVLVIVLYDNWVDGCKLDADIAVKNLRTKKEYEFDSLRDFREFVLDKRGNADSEDIDRAKTIDQLFDLLPYSEYERIR